MRNLIAVLGFLVVLTTHTWAQQKSVCSLLTARDVSAVGVTGKGTENTLPISDGPTKGKNMRLCEWKVATGTVTLSIADMPPGVPFKQLISQMEGTYATLRSQGWKEERKVFGAVSCSMMTPPQPDTPMTTGCVAEAKRLVVSIATLAKTRVPMEKVKALLDSAVNRL